MSRRLREGYGSFAILWLNACVLFGFLNVVVGLAHRKAQPVPLGPMRAAIARAHPTLDAGAIDELVAETDRPLAYEPYTDLTDPPVRGRFVNVDPAGFRYTKDQGPWPPDPQRRNVFLFGGSTTFGYGVGDGDTIASYLQAALRAADGRAVSVYNFGHSAYYSTQERILFERLVVAGHRPDTVVFIDGLNDFVAVDDLPMTADRLAQAYRRFEEPPLRTVLELLPLTTTVRHLGRILGVVEPVALDDRPRPDDPVHVTATLDRYRRSKAVIAAVGAAHGVRTVFVWQPIPVYAFPPGQRGGWSFGSAAVLARQGYPRMAEAAAAHQLGDDFLWCADGAADGTEALYVDFVHYAPVLSERVARCIADGLASNVPHQTRSRLR